MTRHGIFHHLPDIDYRQADGISASTLCEFGSTTPYKYRHKERKTSPALLFGQLVHHLALTPWVEPFWTVKPEGIDYRTKAGKEWRDMQANVPIVTGDDIVQAQAIRDAFFGAWQQFDSKSLAAFAEGREMREVSVFVQGRKCRCDVLHPAGFILDLKTCADSSKAGFGRAAAEFHYIHKAAWYLDAVRRACGKATTFVWVAVEKEAPHEANVYYINEGDARLELAMQDMQRWERQLQECMETDYWPTSTDGAALEIQTPSWAFREVI